MKKSFTICAALALFSLCACNSDDEATIMASSTASDRATEIEFVELSTFAQSVDSLNAAYPTDETRGFWRDIGKQMADQAGCVGGRFIGRWLGAAVGSLTANPAITCLGYVGGQHVGAIVGYAAASAVAEMMYTAALLPSYPQGALDFDANVSIKVSELTSAGTRSGDTDLRADSIGYYHNYVMVRVNQNKNKYISQGVVNANLLFEDIIGYFQEVNIDASSLLLSPSVENAVVAVAKDFAQLSLDYSLNSNTTEELLAAQSSYLSEKCQATKSAIDLHVKISKLIAEKCGSLSDLELHNYANDLNKVIMASDLPIETKYEIAISSETIINSSLCW
jgi:hypothetical protein